MTHSTLIKHTERIIKQPELSISSSLFDAVEKMSQVRPDPPETLDPALVTYNGSPVGDSTRTFFISAATAAHHCDINKTWQQRGLEPIQFPGPDHHLHPGNCLA